MMKPVYKFAIPAVAGLICLISGSLINHRFEHNEESNERYLVAFSEPEMATSVAALPLNRANDLDTNNREWRGFRGSFGHYVPIIRWAPVSHVDVKPGLSGYVAPSLQYAYNWMSSRPVRPPYWSLLIISSSLMLSAGIYLILCRQVTVISGIVGLALVRVASLLWSYYIFGFFTIHAEDESYYYHSAQKILDWTHSFEPYLCTLGNPLLYLPLLLIFGHLSEFAFTGLCGFVYFFVFGLGTIYCVVWIVFQAQKSFEFAFRSGLILAIVPWLIKVYHKPEGIYSYLGLNIRYPVDISMMEFYYYSDLVGYNAMSDSPALFFGLLGICLLCKGIDGQKLLIGAGLALGFSCLIRISNVFYLIPAGYLFLSSIRKLSIKQVVAFSGAFAIALVPQLIWNSRLYGDAFTLAYKFYPRAYSGFELNQIRDGIRIFGHTHYQLLAVAALALLEGQRKHSKLATLFALLIVPILIFYSGFYGIGENPVRYILLPISIMLASAAILFQESRNNARKLGCVILVMVTAMICVPGSDLLAFRLPASQMLNSVICIGMFVIVGIIWKFDLRFASYFFVMASGSPHTVYLYLCISCLIASAPEIKRLSKDLYEIVRNPPRNSNLLSFRQVDQT